MTSPRFDRRRCWLALVLLGLTAPSGQAQLIPPKLGDPLIEKFLVEETGRVSQRVFAGATSADEWQARRARLKPEYFEMLGLWPLPAKTPLNPKVTGTLERDDFVVEKLHFQSRPGLYVTGNLFRPKKAAGKLPAVLYVCGHAGRGRNGNKTAYQDHGMWFASNGYVCLVIDTLQLGEIAGIHHGTYREGRWWWQAAGYTPAGVECWNGVRALDYLDSRPDVDPQRLAVTGISGGGATTFWIAAADERVMCAVPVSGMSDLESYVNHKVINGHCDCTFLINTYGWEWTTIAALVAPRPLLFANSDKDSIFPMDGNRRIIDRLRQLYKMHGKSELVDEYVSVGGHDYRTDLRLAIFKWINKHVKNDNGPVKDIDFPLFKNEELRVFPEDSDVPAGALNGKIDDTFVPRAALKPPVAGKYEEWQANLLDQLRQRSFRTLPRRVPASDLGTALEADPLVGTHWTEPGIKVVRRLLPDKPGAMSVIVLNPDDEATGVPAWARPYVASGSVILLQPRGVGLTEWTTKSPPNYVARAHALLGRTVDEGRVWDIAATVRGMRERSAPEWQTWTVIGRRQAGVLAAYAALFEPSITGVVVVDPPASHRDGPIFLNVLRVCDVPDALGGLAPRPLTLVNAKEPAFDRTAQIYKAAGAADKLQRK